MAGRVLLDKQHQRVLDGDFNALKKPNLSTLLIIAPILLMVGLFSTATSVNILIYNVELNTIGMTAKATITAKKIEGYGRGTVYWASYIFTANDSQPYARSATIGWNEYDTLKIGDQVDVQYLDSMPTGARLKLYDPQERNAIGEGLVLGLPCLAFGLLGLVTAVIRLRRWRRLKTSGQIVEGRIVSMARKPCRGKSATTACFTMGYEFRAPSRKHIQ